MKLTIVGGGSTYTPELMDGFARLRELLPIEDVWLVDPDETRLALVSGVSRRMLARAGHPATVHATTDLVAGVSDADAVLFQLRVGGQDARRGDETWPHEVGCIGQETTGPGGFAKALRTVPVVLNVAEVVRKHAKPNAWIVDFTNPVGIVTRALLQAGHRAVGLCNVAIGFQRSIAGMLGVQADRIEVDQVGLNHLTWIRAVRLDGRDVLPDLLADHGDQLAEEVDVPRRVLEDLGAIPSYYLHYFYAHDRVLAEQRDGVPRAQTVAEIEHELLEMYKDPNLAEKPALLDQRGGAHYSEAAVGLVGSLHRGDEAVHVVDVRNDGTLAGLAADDVVEVPARVGKAGPVPLPQAPLAPELLGLVQHVTAYERLAVEAAITRDPATARKALLSHPLIGQVDKVDALVDALLLETVSR
jgi:6-phospho-beta-glucosidase